MARRSPRPGFIERNLAGLAETVGHAAQADHLAGGGGWLQALDPRAKLIGVALWIGAAVSVRRLDIVVALGLAGALLAVGSRIPLRLLAGQVWVGVLAFTGVIALPAIFLTPGPTALMLPGLGWTVTAPGLRTAGLLLARSETAATLAFTLVLSTPWTDVLKALRVFRVPTVAVVILQMTHRYIFLLLRVATDFFVARRSRQVGALDAAQRRALAAGVAGALLGKSLHLSEEVYQAMQSRGFRGEIRTFDDFRWRPRDGFALAGFLAVTLLALRLGR